MIAKTRLIFLTMIIASLTFGIAALTTNTLLTQSAFAQSSGGTPTYTPPPGGSAGAASPGNSTSSNATK